MEHRTIPSRWLALRLRLDAAFWIAVCKHLEAQGIDPHRATDDDVRAAIGAVDGG